MSPLFAKILGKTPNSALESIRLHLEQLINTRCAMTTLPTHYHQLNQSLLSFGVLPLTNLINWCEQLRRTIQAHEHRLSDVAVTFEHTSAQTPMLVIYAALASQLCTQTFAFGVDLQTTHARVLINPLTD